MDFFVARRLCTRWNALNDRSIKKCHFFFRNMAVWLISLTLWLKKNIILDKKDVLKASNCYKKIRDQEAEIQDREKGWELYLPNGIY